MQFFVLPTSFALSVQMRANWISGDVGVPNASETQQRLVQSTGLLAP
eukprot:CAMPEP_0204518374 /NCGR_PEP_ID=MMETSP0661-20131031/4168_1 /ASSEMBLY_ACC=CAM_ASM_000606 /TAXON_ID=109239 /ORGANISM="Alexandrium margalefi, Strain AMGDE01CS-322" /LENGTH=46 /DNA_ID= /DNA_START= /DNA_END= /DNA_ORIENTATION=